MREHDQGQADGDRFRQHGACGQDDAAHGPVAGGGVERGEVEHGGEERRAGRHVVHGLGVQGMDGHDERRADGDRHCLVAQPEVIADDAEYQQGHEPVQEEIHQVIAPRVEPGELVVGRHGHQQQRPEVLVLVQDRRRVGIDEVAGIRPRLRMAGFDSIVCQSSKTKGTRRPFE